MVIERGVTVVFDVPDFFVAIIMTKSDIREPLGSSSGSKAC